MPEFDVVVLGAGTSGLLIATEVARSGRSAAVVEAGLVGGESPYLASLPSKSMLHSAQRGQTWEFAVARRQEVAGGLDDSAAAAGLAACGVTLVRGMGRVRAPGAVEVIPVGEHPAGVRPGAEPDPGDMADSGGGVAGPDGRADSGERSAADTGARAAAGADPAPGDAAPADAAAGGSGGPPMGAPVAVLGYRDLVIATGSEPVAPPIEGLVDVPTWTSADALSSPRLPRRLIVLGAGRVGCELAQAYAAFGSAVTLVEAESRVLPDEPAFVGQILGGALRRAGADLRLGSAAVKAEALESGLALILADGARLEADRVLLATGRRPRASGLGLGVLGVSPSPSGALAVDAACRVVTGKRPVGRSATGPGGGGPGAGGRLWAAGDVTGVGPYTHIARYQAGIVAANILGGRRTANYVGIPRVVRTSPSVCCVGLTPGPAAESAGVSLRSAGGDLPDTARAAVDDDDCGGRVELYLEPGRGDMLAGAAAIGPHAEEWMSEVALAIRARLSLAVLADMVRPYPAYGEAMERALRELAGGTPGEEHG